MIVTHMQIESARTDADIPAYIPLTKEKLVEALTAIQMHEHNIDTLFFLKADEYGWDGREGDYKWARMSAEELYSDALLNAINADMQPVCASESCAGNPSLTDIIISAEEAIGHDVEYMPRIWPKPAAQVGWDEISSCMYGGYEIAVTNYTYIDIDGEVFGVHECSLSYGGCQDALIGRTLTNDYWMSLRFFEDVFPSEYDGFWSP